MVNVLFVFFNLFICKHLPIYLLTMFPLQLIYLDRYLAENPWKAHEEFGLLLDDIDRDLPNPRHRRPMFWEALNGASRRPHSRQNRTDDGQKIYVANGLFVQSGFSIRLDYKDVIETVYRSTLHTLDFIRNGQHAMEFLNT